MQEIEKEKAIFSFKLLADLKEIHQAEEDKLKEPGQNFSYKKKKLGEKAIKKRMCCGFILFHLL